MMSNKAKMLRDKAFNASAQIIAEVIKTVKGTRAEAQSAEIARKTIVEAREKYPHKGMGEPGSKEFQTKTMAGYYKERIMDAAKKGKKFKLSIAERYPLK